MAHAVDTVAAAHAKDQGNASYKKGKWVEAIGHYTTSSVLNPSDPAPLLNRSQAYLKLEKWSDAIRDCTSVLSIPGNQKNVKALFRRATGRKEIGDIVGARQDLERILSIEPMNTAAKEELESLPSLPIGRGSTSKPNSTTIQKSPSTVIDSSTTTASQSSVKPISIPIRIVDRFSTLPTAHSTTINTTSSGTTTSNIIPINAIAGSSTSPTPSQHRIESFSSLKETRSTKKRNYVDADVPVKSSTISGDTTVYQEERELRIWNSGLEWILDWERGNEESRLELLVTTSSSHLFNLISPLLEPDLLASILYTLHHFQTMNPINPSNKIDNNRMKTRIRTILFDMKNMTSFEMMRTMLSEEEKKWEREIESWCEGI